MIRRMQLIALLLLLLGGCNSSTVLTLPSQQPQGAVESTAHLPASVDAYLDTNPVDPAAAQFFPLINDAMPLNDAELALLAQNRFVVTDRLQWNRFVEAYAWIYKHDLPVVVTSDSILHAFHQSYANLLQTLEVNLLQPQLVQFLRMMAAEIASTGATISEPELAALYQDVHDYLVVGLVLATGSALEVDGERYRSAEHDALPVDRLAPTLNLDWLRATYGPRVTHLVQLAWNADSVTSLASEEQPALFNSTAPTDFTRFQPRAHYTKSLLLSNYFRAMAWLGQVDLRIVTFDPLTGEAMLNQEALTAASILHAARNRADQRAAWEEIDKLFNFLIGPADNMTFTDLDQLIADMRWQEPRDILQTNPEQLLAQLLNHDYGRQRITGQLISRHIANASEEPIERPVSFLLFGQRFVLDSWILGNLVYDMLVVDGKPVERALPTGFDLMVALGNDHAQAHLTDELATYGYESTLASLRQQVDALDATFWQAPLYNQWLQLIRSLNAPTTAANFPAAMRTAAWADKSLQTQLAAWAQLRHDHLLYAKQSHTTVQILCEFPGVYVEPYPALYQALAAYALRGKQLLQTIDASAVESAQVDLATLEQYFVNVAESATALATISEKELAGVPLTATEDNFLKSLVMVQEYTLGCGGASFEEMWDGWYMHLIYGKDDSPALIVDVHTNPNNDPQSALYPPRVLHVGTGPATAMLMIVDTAAGPTLFVGPVYAYYEFAEEGFPPVRLNDEAWRTRLAEPAHYPAAPAWVSSFRLAVDTPSEPFALPKHEEYKFPGK